jgi:hypothetical protein
MRGDRGQASVEWTGLVALVCVLLALVLAVRPAAVGEIPRAVADGFLRALCVVGGGDCARDLEPCVVASDRQADGWRARVLFVELGSGWTALVERRSDGTFVMTRVRSDLVGLGAGKSFAALGIGGEARVRALLTADDTLSWQLPDRAAVDALVRRLRSDRWASLAGPGLLRAVLDGTTDLPRPEAAGRALGVSLGATLGAGAGGLGAGLDLEGAGVVGRRALRDGGQVVYLELSGAAAAELSLAVEAGGRRDAARDGAEQDGVRSEEDGDADVPAALEGSAGAGAAGTVTLGVEVDARGRAVDLSLVRTGLLRTSASLPPELGPLAEQVAGRATGVKLWELVHHLDLTQPDNAGAVRGLLGALRRASPTAALAAARELGGRLSSDGAADARTYALQEEGDDLVDVDAVVGAFSAGGQRVQARLVGAASRGPSGLWRARTDCLGAV